MNSSLRSVRPLRLGMGWIVSAALTALILVAAEAFFAVPSDIAGQALWAVVAVAIGFYVGGFFLGSRAAAAPLLHAVLLLVVSVVLYLVVSLVVAPTGIESWDALRSTSTLVLAVVQFAAAFVGTRSGVRWTRRGRTGAA
ncbi:MAG TPA: hypothetical protein VFI96_01280 [Longimicrobiaceae bacterium]|nr:hypothetical protein [Longimicrobiaceae bacterium]